MDSDEELHTLKLKMKTRNETNGFKHIQCVGETQYIKEELHAQESAEKAKNIVKTHKYIHKVIEGEERMDELLK